MDKFNLSYKLSHRSTGYLYVFRIFRPNCQWLNEQGTQDCQGLYRNPLRPYLLTQYRRLPCLSTDIS
ncbi:hypothetical protein ACTXT7_016235, partial [Hymenolepis weldensis]